MRNITIGFRVLSNSKWVQLLASALILSTSCFSYAESLFNKTLYVNCDGGWEQSINQTIKWAREGDTVMVSGECTENVIIEKNINLEGTNSAQIIPADNTDPTILVSGSTVSIKGFVLSAPSEGAQIYTTNRAQVTISDNVVSNAQNGISVAGASLVTIINNSILANEFGIVVNESATVRVGFVDINGGELFPNVIENNNAGITIARAFGNVAGNRIVNNQNGVVVARSGSARVAGNEISGNNIGIVNITNGSTDLAIAPDNAFSPLFGVPNYGQNTLFSFYCNSGFIGDRTGNNFFPVGVTQGSCINATTP